jgi:hypothetical protein
LAYLASDGFFTGWDADFDSDVASIFHGRSPDTILLYFFIAVGLKILVLLGFLVWLNKKI